MRYLLAALLSVTMACSATADGPSGAEDAADASTPTDAATGDAGDPYPLSWWLPQACYGAGQTPGNVAATQSEVCAALPPVPPGTVETWCDLRGLDSDTPRTGLTPWPECIAWAISAQASVLPRGVPAWVADCAPPPPCQGVTEHHCPGRAVHYGVEVQQWVYAAWASGRCWPAR